MTGKRPAAAPEVDVEGFWRDGYTLVSGVFTPAEIASLRERALRQKGWKGDLLTNPELSDVVTEPRLAQIAQQILGGPPVYFGYSSVTYGKLGRGYHKDCADRHDPGAPDWRGRYTLIRMGMYLQDHADHSGGLNVVRGSHNRPHRTKGRTQYLASRPGDVVAWNLRTSHSANGVVLKFPKRLPVNPDAVRWIPKPLLCPEGPERVAVFLTYALDDAHYRRYLKYLAARKFMVDIWSSSPLTGDLARQAEAAGLVVEDVWREIQGWPDLGVNVEHRDIPY